MHFFASDFVQPFHEDILDFALLESDSNLTVMSDKGKVMYSKLQAAADQSLDFECYKYKNDDTQVYNDESVKLHNTLCKILMAVSKFLFCGMVRYLIILVKINLSKSILKSNLKSLVAST